MRSFATGLGLLLAIVSLSCSTYRDHLSRGQEYYDRNEFGQALAIWRVLEADMDSLSAEELARYAYLRGMTDYRLGFRPHARHWLAIAKAVEKKHPGGLQPTWQARADEALEDLNKDVFGIERLDDSESTAVEHVRGNASEESKEPPAGSDPAASDEPKPCRSDADCSADQMCISKRCLAP